ncbi:MAG: transposase [Anaerolineales bacterium]|nr:transposase [Anaerolineales bacterium]
MVTKVFKYRLYPTKAQRTAMNDTLDACRWVYNKTLELRKEAWEERGESISRYETINMLPDWKREYPWLKQAHSQVLQEVCTRVDLAFQSFFRRCKADQNPGYPRFQGRGWYKSFTYPQSGFELLENERLRLSKIGNMKIVYHRPLEGEMKRLHIKRDALGNWFACFVVELEPEHLPPVSQVVGVDVGLEKFATLSNGDTLDNPRFFRQEEKDLAKAQRKLSECKKGTREYHKRRRVVRHIHRRIKNKRKDFIHKLSRWLVDNYQIIVFEDLDIQTMQDGNYRSMNKSIGDAARNVSFESSVEVMCSVLRGSKCPS